MPSTSFHSAKVEFSRFYRNSIAEGGLRKAEWEMRSQLFPFSINLKAFGPAPLLIY
jgi:hypothetical protein